MPGREEGRIPFITKRPGEPVLSSFVFLDTTGTNWNSECSEVGLAFRPVRFCNCDGAGAVYCW